MGNKPRTRSVKVATLILGEHGHSALINKALRQSKEALQTTLDTVRSFRERFLFLERKYRYLVARFRMLKPLLEDKSLQRRLARDGKERGASLIVDALFDACVLDCYTLLKDGEEENPSVLTLVQPFLRKNRKKHTELFDQFKSLYANRKTYWPDQMNVEFPPEHRQAWIAKNRRECAARRRTFVRIANELTNDWASLSQAAEKFRSVRAKWIAHYELEFDEATQRFRHHELPDLKDMYATLNQVVRLLTKAVRKLSKLLIGADMPLAEFERFAKEDADAFWGIRQAGKAGAQRPTQLRRQRGQGKAK